MSEQIHSFDCKIYGKTAVQYTDICIDVQEFYGGDSDKATATKSIVERRESKWVILIVLLVNCFLHINLCHTLPH